MSSVFGLQGLHDSDGERGLCSCGGQALREAHGHDRQVPIVQGFRFRVRVLGTHFVTLPMTHLGLEVIETVMQLQGTYTVSSQGDRTAFRV